MKTKNLKYLVGSLVLVFSLVLLGSAFYSGDEDGGNIKFIAPDKVTISSIFTEGLKRCRTAMDYIITGGYCYDFLDKIGYVTDFSIGYEIILYPYEYDVGDSYTWHFYGPKKQEIIGSWDFIYEEETGLYCWVSTKGDMYCWLEKPNLIAFMIWHIFPCNFHREETIIGEWRVEVRKNDEVIAFDNFTLIDAGYEDRDEAKEDLDSKWDKMSMARRKDKVESLSNFNTFTGSSARLNARQIDKAIDQAKIAYPEYKDFDSKLIKAMIEVESSRNYLAISAKQALGLGQEVIYCDEDKTTATIKPHDNFLELKNRNLTSQDFVTFKETTLIDNRTLPVESIAIMFAHLTELMNIDYIGSDLKKILAGYNWGQGNLKGWLDNFEKENKNWFETLSDKHETKKYINKVLREYNKGK